MIWGGMADGNQQHSFVWFECILNYELYDEKHCPRITFLTVFFLHCNGLDNFAPNHFISFSFFIDNRRFLPESNLNRTCSD